MPKVTGATVAVTALILITLTGCAGAPESAGDESPEPVASPSATPEGTAAPLVAETPAESTQVDAETAYLEFLRAHPREGTVIPNATDAQRLEAGYKICALLAQGEEGQDITVIEGEQRNPESGTYIDSYDMYSAAATSGLCK